VLNDKFINNVLDSYILIGQFACEMNVHVVTTDTWQTKLVSRTAWCISYTP